LLCLLSETFPDVFVRDSGKPIRPLAIGIRHAVAALLPEIPAPKIGKAIGLYTALVRAAYLTALIEGQPRIDLEGNIAGVPTEAERERAKTELAVWQEKWLEKRKQQAKLRRSELKSRKTGQVDQVGAPVPKQKAEKAPRSWQ
jgi:sRNA-binding protein